MKINNIVGNPPYNGPGAGRPPIYHTITELQARHVNPDRFAWIVQYNWLTQLSAVGREMRRSLLKMGVYRIEDNRFTGFTEATVRTCTIYCEQGYTGDIELVDKEYGTVLPISRDLFAQTKIPPVYDTAEKDLLLKLRDAGELGEWTTQHAFNKGKPYPTYAISTSYFADFVNGGINKLQLLSPATVTPGSQRVFQGYESITTLAEAEVLLERMKSYWTSNLVKFILSRTLTSRTLDNPQLVWIPVVPMDRIWTEQELINYFNLTADEVALINNRRIAVSLYPSATGRLSNTVFSAALTESKNRAVFRDAARKDLNGEVFTPTELVLHMITQLSPAAWEPTETFLDPTCGNGQILAAIAVIKRELGHTDYLKTIYGVDLMEDNVAECRERLLLIAGDTPENRLIVERNITQGNAMFDVTYRQFNTDSIPSELFTVG